ncbi:MAG: ABC transporter permease [Bifidobacteriaceae bacterium]|nr:ABC transporter permease [Bifidobacteriaceae bacterium]
MTNTLIIPASERRLNNYVSMEFTFKNTLTFAYRSLVKGFKNPESFADVVIMPVMFTLMFTYLFGGAISGDVTAYLPIIVPGILMQTCVTGSSNAASQLREDMDKNTTSRFKSMPIARIAPLAGILTADLVRYAIAGVITFAVGALIGYRPPAGLFAVLACILFMSLIAWCLSWLFAFIAMKVKSVAAASSGAMLIMFPMAFLSNAFAPTETMPSAIRFFAEHINPLSKAVSATREILAYGTLSSDFYFALLGSLAILAVFIPLTVRAYGKRR